LCWLCVAYWVDFHNFGTVILSRKPLLRIFTNFTKCWLGCVCVLVVRSHITYFLSWSRVVISPSPSGSLAVVVSLSCSCSLQPLFLPPSLSKCSVEWPNEQPVSFLFHTSPCKWDNADGYVGDTMSSLLYGKPCAFRLTWEIVHWSFTIVSHPLFHMFLVWRLTCKYYTTVLFLSCSYLSFEFHGNCVGHNREQV